MAPPTGPAVLIAILSVLLGLLLAVPRSFAVEDMRDSSGSGKSKTKSCPKGTKFSPKKRGCVKVSCAASQVWSSGAEACIDRKSAELTDEDLYLGAGEFIEEGSYSNALFLLVRIKDRQRPNVLNLIGYTTRKLGNIDKGIDYYHEALALDPDYTKARQYLGEAYLLKGDVSKAKEQLAEIKRRCDDPCEDYTLLAQAITFHGTGAAKPAW